MAAAAPAAEPVRDDAQVVTFEEFVSGARRDRRQDSLATVLDDTWAALSSDEQDLLCQLRAVRDADRTTQSFKNTVVYCRLGDAVGLAPEAALADRTLDDIADEAFAWMESHAERGFYGWRRMSIGGAR